ncbi:MAG: hypothetical protein H6833_11505 [Planctomycetes bacterium]|nr:hypothetical protein [Planctomycetota bacterium]
MFAWITLLLVLASLGLELFLLRIGYFRTIHWESLSLLVLACATAAMGFRQRKGVLTATTFLLTLSILAGMAYMTVVYPRLPLKEAAFEREDVAVHLVLRTPADQPLMLPEGMTRDYALLVFYRGMW